MPTLSFIFDAGILQLLVFLLPLLMGMARIESGLWEENTHPEWIKDYLTRDRVLPAGTILDASAFPNTKEVTLTAAANAAGETTLDLQTAVPQDRRGRQLVIPAGTVLDFGSVVATTTAEAVTGDTVIQVEALGGTGTTGGDTATYNGGGGVYVPAGTLVGRTRAEADADPAGQFGPVAYTAGTSVDDDEVYLTVHTVTDATENAETELLRHDTLIVPDRLPGWANMDAVLQTWIRDNYDTITAVA